MSVSKVTIVDQQELIATGIETQRKTFRNPRGQRYVYALFYYRQVGGPWEIRIYKSQYGLVWAYDSSVFTSVRDSFVSCSLAYYDDGSKLVIYVVADESVSIPKDTYKGSILYRRGVIQDGDDSITWDASYTLRTYVADIDEKLLEGYSYPVIVRGADNFIYVAFRKRDFLASSEENYVDGRPAQTQGNGWTQVGLSPWLDAIDSVNKIRTAITDDAIGDFSFANPTILGDQRFIDLWCIGDGDDWVEVWLYNADTAMWVNAGNIFPAGLWSWKSLDVSALINNNNKMVNLRMALVKKRAGKAGEIQVDAGRLRVVFTGITLGWSARVIASTVTDNPTVAQWSDEEIIVEGGTAISSPYWNMWPTIVAFSAPAAVDVLIPVVYYDALVLTTRVLACELSWDGAAFTQGIKAIWQSASGTQLLSAVVDTDDLAYVVIHTNFLDLYIRRWQVGVGWLALASATISIGHPLSMTVTLDKTSTPHYIYIMSNGTLWGYNPDEVTFARKRVDNWWLVREIVGRFSDDSENLDYFQGYLLDDNAGIALIYTTQTNRIVRYMHYPEIIVPPECEVARAQWPYYMAFAKRAFDFHYHHGQPTADNEVTVLISEFVLRGLEECALDQIAVIAKTKAELARSEGY